MIASKYYFYSHANDPSFEFMIDGLIAGASAGVDPHPIIY